MGFPEELHIAYEQFMMIATKHKMTFAGMMVGLDPPSMIAIGNVNEKGYEFAKLLRKYAQIIEEKTDKGLVRFPEPRNVN